MEKYEYISDEIDKVILSARAQRVLASTTRKRVLERLTELFSEINKTEKFASPLSK